MGWLLWIVYRAGGDREPTPGTADGRQRFRVYRDAAFRWLAGEPLYSSNRRRFPLPAPGGHPVHPFTGCIRLGRGPGGF